MQTNKIKIFLKIPGGILIVLFIVLFCILNNFIVLHLDNTYPTYDEFNNWKLSLDIYQQTSEFSLKNFLSKETYKWFYHLGMRIRPPFYNLALSLFYKISYNIDSLRIANILFFAILLFSIYGIGLEIKDRSTGVLAAFLVSTFPGIFAMSRVLMVDFPLTAMLTLCVYTMLKTKYFTNTKYSVLFGIMTGIGMLTKVSFLLLVSPLLIYYIIVSARKTDRKTANVLSNICIFFLASITLSMLWYAPNIDRIIARGQALSFGEPFNNYSFIEYYLNQIYSYHLGLFFSLLAIFALIYVIRKIFLLVVWICVPLLLFSISPNKCPRFIVPLLPAIALMIAFSVTSIRRDFLQKVIAILLCCISLLSFFLISYGKINLYPKITRGIKNGLYAHQRFNYGILFPLQKVNWKIPEIGNIILSNWGLAKDRVILSVFNVGEIHDALSYYLQNKSLSITILCPAAADCFDSLTIEQFFNTSRKVESFNFVMLKDGYQGGNTCSLCWIELLKEEFLKVKDKFMHVGTVKGLPDGSSVYIFKNKDA